MHLEIKFVLNQHNYRIKIMHRSGLVSTLADSRITQEKACQPNVLTYLRSSFPSTNSHLSAFFVAMFAIFFIIHY